MALRIITADERAQETAGVKAVIAGPYGIGKTSQLRTLDPVTTLFVDTEDGDLAVQDVYCDGMRPTTWPECRMLAAFLGGPNPAYSAGAVYGQEHYDAAVELFGSPQAMDKYATYFVDGITKASRLCMSWALQQPEAFNDKGKLDTRGAYGLLGREMLNWVTQLQHARGKNVIFTVAMEQGKDDFGRLVWETHLEGAKTGRELPGIVDLFVSFTHVDFGDGQPVRAFVCQKDNPYGLPAKDRSGRLDVVEAPDLGKLIAKASDQGRQRAGFTTTVAPPADVEPA